ncbi:MAG TPA: hypothetical protein VG326_11345 [Tepidisphaeraceae bacterium]|jgi:heme exporter protein D|nr:hypothetical protein [Tepidisphaeraceae bacterium]
MTQPPALTSATPRPHRPAGVWSIPAFTVSATALGFAIHQHDGEYSPLALILLTLSIVACAIGVIFFGKPSPLPTTRRKSDLLAAALALQFIALFILWPVSVDQREQYRSIQNHVIYLYLTAVAAMALLCGVLDLPKMRRFWFPALLLFHSMLGFWMVRSAPLPHIDVWYFQEDGPSALLHGHDPYDAAEARFADIYQSTHEGHQRVYGQGMVIDDTLQFGFPYPPISLFCSTIGFLIGSDTRYAQAVALTLAGMLIGYCRPGRFPKLAAALFLFTPTEWFVLGRAWTEPFVVMFLAAIVFCASRKIRGLLPVVLGLFLASKQYLAFAVPLSFLLLDDFRWRQKESWIAWSKLLIGAAIAAAVVTLPMALWNWRAFWFSTVTVQAKAPFRWDALSYLVWIGFHVDSKYTSWVWLSFAAAVLAIVLSIRKVRSGPGGFAAALALTYMVFIALNKQAFCNYYFFVIGCLCCAVAAFLPHTKGEVECYTGA